MLRTKNDKTKNINGIKFSAELWNSRVKGGGLHLEEQDVKDFREDTRWPCPGGRIIAWRGRGEARKEKTRADDGPGLSLSLFLFLSSWVVSNGEAISISQLVEPVPRPGDDPRRQREFHPARILSLPPLSLSLFLVFSSQPSATTDTQYCVCLPVIYDDANRSMLKLEAIVSSRGTRGFLRSKLTSPFFPFPRIISLSYSYLFFNSFRSSFFFFFLFCQISKLRKLENLEKI